LGMDIPGLVCQATWFDRLLCTFSMISISPSLGQ
jgi:hypothetical protein